MSKYRKELVSPDGDRYVSMSPIETNDLIYGSGYREVRASAEDSDTQEESGETDVNPYAYGGELSP